MTRRARVRGRALRRRYGRAGQGHPLFPRLVVELSKEIRGKVPVWILTGKIQPHYGGAWKTVYTSAPYWHVGTVRTVWRSLGRQLAVEHSVPMSHVEYVS